MKTNKRAIKRRGKRLALKSFFSRRVKHNKRIELANRNCFNGYYSITRLVCSNGLVIE